MDASVVPRFAGIATFFTMLIGYPMALAPVIRKYIPGNPTVVPQNVAGAGSLGLPRGCPRRI